MNIDWQVARTWAMANIRTIIFILGTFLLLGFIFFGGSTPDNKIPGGGFGTLILAGLLFWGSFKARQGVGAWILGIFAIILLMVAIWPRIAPNIIMIFAISVGILLFKDGKGFLAWRMFLFIFLVLCWIGTNGKLFKDGFTGFLSSTGIELKVPDIKIEVPEFLKGATSYLGHLLDQGNSEFKERWVGKETKLYKYDGAKFSQSAVTDVPFKVFILEETIQKDGLYFEKVRLGDPATGEEFWVYAGSLLTPSQMNTPSASVPLPNSNSTQTTSNTPTNDTRQWQEVQKVTLDFSKLKGELMGKGYQAVFPLDLRVPPGKYRVSIKGAYELFMGQVVWKKITWKGNNSVSSEPNFKPYPEIPYGAIVLKNNGKIIFPQTDAGVEVDIQHSEFSAIANFFVNNQGDFYSEKISERIIFKNDKSNPVSIIIEREI